MTSSERPNKLTRLLSLWARAFLIACFLASPHQVWAVACNTIFANGIQATSATGNISLSYHSLVTGGTATLPGKTLTDSSSWAACSGSNCAASGTAAPTSTPTFQNGTGANGNISIAFQGSGTYSSGNYGTVNVAQEGILKFNDNSGTYKTSGFTTGLRSEVWLRSGDYWINGNLTLGQETILRRLSPSGTTRIFVNGNVSMAFKVATASFNSDQLLIYATGTITAGQQVTLNAFVYGGGNVSFGFQSVVNGAVSGSNFIASANEVTVNYQPSSFSTADFNPFCGNSSTVSYYGISMSATGVTCAAEPVLISAYDSVGNLVAPTAGTQISLGTSTGTGAWVGGNTYSFSGSETSVTKYLQQTTGSTLNVNVTDGVHSELGTLDPSITFADSALKFSTIATQEAGVADATVTLQAIRTDTNTGACVARVTGTRAVKLAYVCRNPIVCISGETLTLGGNAIQPNPYNLVLNPTYNTLNLTFDATGTASIPLVYSDVGQVSLAAQLPIAASGNDPATTLSGTSLPFVVKPYSLAISAVQDASGIANPGGTSTPSARFVSAGTSFKVFVQARNSAGTPTPNFGNENPVSELTGLTLTATSVVYPAGSSITPLTNTGSFVATTPVGTSVNTGIAWKQVGSLVITPSLGDSDYIGGGNIARIINSGTVGRIYPERFGLSNLTLTNSCTSFAYMGQPMPLTYKLQAQAVDGTVLTNFAAGYGLTNLSVNAQAYPAYVAETNNTGDGATISTRMAAAPASASWVAGELNFTGTLQFNRQTSTVPDGPFSNVQLGLQVVDGFDGRSLQGADMDPNTNTVCGSACTAKALGSPMSIRYGRLRLDSAFGPETVKLPVSFITEYWVGNSFVINGIDSCTLVPRSAITYNWGASSGGPLTTDANRTVALSSGNTTGTYANIDASLSGSVHFAAGNASQYFTAPSSGGSGSWVIKTDLTNLSWLRYDWNQDGNYSDVKLPDANFSFGSYRGNDRVIYWREKL